MVADMPIYAASVGNQAKEPYPEPAAAQKKHDSTTQDDAIALKERAAKIEKSLTLHVGFYGETECRRIEQFIDVTGMQAAAGQFSGQSTVDPTPRRTKYFFGNGYTYGYGRRGSEELLPVGAVDEIPDWMQQFVIQPLVQQGIVPKGWIDSVVMNDYQVGGCIVAHVDPPQLFARPILTASFFCPARLVFGASFDPQRSTPPVYAQPVPRGSVLTLAGYSADKVTHGMRPEDMFGTRRVSIVLRHVLEDAPKVGMPAPRLEPSGNLDEKERSMLIREVQGSWCDPGRTQFYDVKNLSVKVTEIKQGEQGRTAKASWRLAPREHGIICNGGLLDLRGLASDRLEWRPLNQNSDNGFVWVWLRVRD